MNEPVVSSFLDVLLFVVPSLGFLLLSLFGLDEQLIFPRHGYSNRRAMCGVDAEGEPILSDPDGRPVPASAKAARPSAKSFAQPANLPFRQSK